MLIILNTRKIEGVRRKRERDYRVRAAGKKKKRKGGKERGAGVVYWKEMKV